MHSSEIVCQVANQDSQVEFTGRRAVGSSGPTRHRGATGRAPRGDRAVRKALEGMVYALNQAGRRRGPWEPCYELAEAGFRLYNYLLPTEDETAKKVRRWLEELRKQSEPDRPGGRGRGAGVRRRFLLSVPWNLVYDERPAKHKAAFQTGRAVERWRPFWSVRYNLTSGRRVEPLKRTPDLGRPPGRRGHRPDRLRGPRRRSRSSGWTGSWPRRA